MRAWHLKYCTMVRTSSDAPATRASPTA